MAMTLAALKSELLNDPTTLGYAAFISSGVTWQLADLLNAPRAGISVFRSSIKTWEVIANTVKAEYDSLPAGDKQLYGILVSSGEIDATNAAIRAMFASIFGASTTTRTQLGAMASRQGSRAEQLFGVPVSTDDCAAALRS